MKKSLIRSSAFVTRPFTILLALGCCRLANAADYYFSPEGHDTADGRSPQKAWKSLGQVWAAGLKGGDQILLQRGGVWHENLTIPADGESGHPIVVSAYGEGAPPCIDAADPVDASKFKTGAAVDVFLTPVNGKVSALYADGGPSLDLAVSLKEVNAKAGTFWCDNGQLYVHPEQHKSPITGAVRLEISAREFCVEISKSHVAIRSLSLRHAARVDRGAVTVWAEHELNGIELSDCDISCNSGRGAWFCGPATSAIHDVLVKGNTFRENDGTGLSLTLANGGEISGNTFTHNCRRAIENWQAGIRLWSSGVSDLTIDGNSIADERWMHDHDSAVGIHCDETGPHVVIANNKIQHVDHAGIEVENTRGVLVEKNTIADCNIGIFINRAGHDHIIRGNSIKDCRSQGLAIQGWLAHGVDAQPEITVEGRLLTRNLFEDNFSTGSRYGNLKATHGGEQVDPPLGNSFRNNDLGSQRKGFIEWGANSLDTYDQWPVKGGGPAK